MSVIVGFWANSAPSPKQPAQLHVWLCMLEAVSVWMRGSKLSVSYASGRLRGVVHPTFTRRPVTVAAPLSGKWGTGQSWRWWRRGKRQRLSPCPVLALECLRMRVEII
jgi:hypothetical protein